MNKLSKEKRSQLALTVVMILVVGTGLYMGLIRYQQAKIRTLAVEKEKGNRKLAKISEIFRSGSQIETELAVIRKELDSREDEMVSDDLYSSMINNIRKFKLAYPVEIQQFNSKGQADLNLFPRFPYKQFTVSILGTAYYHDLGKFIADFENKFRSSRILNLELTTDPSQAAGEGEKLIFRMEIVSLVKPGGPSSEKKP